MHRPARLAALSGLLLLAACGPARHDLSNPDRDLGPVVAQVSRTDTLDASFAGKTFMLLPANDHPSATSTMFDHADRLNFILERRGLVKAKSLDSADLIGRLYVGTDPATQGVSLDIADRNGHEVLGGSAKVKQLPASKRALLPSLCLAQAILAGGPTGAGFQDFETAVPGALCLYGDQ